MTRRATNKLIEYVDDGLLNARFVMVSALLYMSEDEVADMAHINGMFDDEDAEDEQK